ncbi:hypothetical protein PILCRDRAFT_827107 [Piloderma croceum F 1598]|uniref:Uncharacterized protein n=1 Tax=Piloderma croceum (strain F 1598) TaxID=765440 RepID=A0A0C3BE26_PILCF|nr:hypothetical protein PILCRDRAFT_827107 [Piloderma croceum F 1598]
MCISVKETLEKRSAQKTSLTIIMSQQNSRPPSVESERELEEEPITSPRQQSRTRRRRRRTPRSASVSSEEPGQSPNYENQRHGRDVAERKSGLPAVNELGDAVGGVTQTASGVADTATGAVSKVGNTVGNVAASVGGDKPLKLRLDINLDIEIELEARVHGDLTLALLR